MKIDRTLVQHLLKNRKLTLQGIGTFSLDDSVSLPVEFDKEVEIPENVIKFEFNPKAEEEDAVIDTIVQYTQKIKPLASADLDSFLMLGRQFLNIGKPFTIEGLGTLDKSQSGELFFVPGHFIIPKIEAPKPLTEYDIEEKTGLFRDYDSQVKRNSNKSIIKIVLFLVCCIILAITAYYFFFKTADKLPGNEVQKETTDIDTAEVKDNITAEKTASLNDYTFMIVFLQTKNKEEAIKILHKYRGFGHKIIMYSYDSVEYKLAEPFTLPLSDTTRIKDSLNKYYYVGEGRVDVRKKQQ